MADTKLSALTEDTSPAATDWFYKVNSGGTVDRKVSYANLLSAAPMGVIDGTDAAYGMVGDALTVSDGTVASGSLSTLTSATGLFTSAHVGKTVTIFRMLQVTDAAITSGTATLTSPGNQFPTWIVAGMEISVSGAGASGQSLYTTVVTRNSAGSLTLNNNAGTTVSGKSAIIIPIHRTTIASYTSATSVGLTAAAPYAFAGANVLWGTDNRAAFASAGAAAIAANKTLWVPAGNYLMALDATNQYGVDFTSDTFTLRGAGRDATRFFIAGMNSPSTQQALVHAGIDANVDVADFQCANYGIPFVIDYGAFGGSIVIVSRDGTAGQTCRVARVDTDPAFPMSSGVNIQGGSGTADSRLYVDDCNLYVWTEPIAHFTNTGTDARQWVRNTYLQSGYPLETTTNDSEYNCHVTYIHGPVGIWWENVTLKTVRPTSGSVFHLHNFGSPTGTPPFHMFINVRSEGTIGNGFYQHEEASDITTVVGGYFQHKWSLNGGASFFRSRHAVPANAPIQVQGGTNHTILIDEPIIDLTASNVSSEAMLISAPGQFNVIRVKNPVFRGMPSTGSGRVIIGAAANNSANYGLFDIDGVKFDGDSTYFDTFMFIRQGFKYRVRNCVLGGTWQGAPGYGLFTSDATTGSGMELWLHNNDFDVATPVIFDAGLAAGQYVRGSGNIFRNGVIDPQANGLRGSLEPPDAINPTTVTSAASTTLDWNYRTHRVSGSATINNLFYGGSANKNCLFGGTVRLIVDGGATPSTWSTSAAGNIVPLTTAIRTPGTVLSFVWDAVAGKWYETAATSGYVRSTGDTITGTAPSSIHSVNAALLVDGQATDTNGFVFHLASGTPSGYGKGQGILLLKAGTGDATDQTATGSALGRWDIDGIGVHSVHVTPGYRNGKTPTQAIWIQNFIDTVGVAITGYSSQTVNLFQIVSSASATLFAVSGAGQVKIAAGSATTPALANQAETGTGIYWTAGNVGLTINGTLKSYQSSTAFTLIAGVGIALGEGSNIGFGTSTGTQIGATTTQKLAFHAATPVAQRAGSAQVAVATTSATQTTPFGYTTAAQANGIVTLLNEIRAALVEKGLIKGAA